MTECQKKSFKWYRRLCIWLKKIILFLVEREVYFKILLLHNLGLIALNITIHQIT
jgi:hypothetical protein